MIEERKKDERTGSNVNNISRNSTEIAVIHHQENTNTNVECLK
jgi:hypothetical protein